MSEIDWSTELRKIEREYDGLPPEPSPGDVRAQRAAEQRAHEEAERRGAVFGANARLVLVAALFAALWWWPYETRCGPGLLGLVATQGMIVVGSIWVAVHTFRHRVGTSHTVALVFLVTGLALLAGLVLPRLGYVTITGMEPQHWRCMASGL